MNYRREIDGLRAVAVLPVIFFHAGFDWFEGGFVGVDVFFVISGYLITSIIVEDKEAGRFSLARFYERRVRRILPALFLVMGVCIPFAWLWMLPSDMKGFAQSVGAVAVFLSNVLFWMQSGYFDTAAELKPLLHTWSLAVEEQYYLLFPLFLGLVWTLGRRGVVALIAIGSIVSLAFAQWGAYHMPSAAFFLLPTRAWELGLGALTALCMRRERSDNAGVGQVASGLGLALILYAALDFDETTLFPGLYALVPTIGAVLVIVFATPANAVGKLLGKPVFVGVGLISYSAYLWHQPLFAFARHRNVDEPETWVFVALSFAAIVLAYLSWRFVETPFRSPASVGRKKLFALAALLSVCFIVFAAIGHYTDGFSGRVPAAQKEILVKLAKQEYLRNVATKVDVCHYSDATKIGVDRFLAQWPCKGDFAPGLKKIPLAITGDSHSSDVAVAFRQNGYSPLELGGSGCSLVPRLMSVECKKIYDRLREELRKDDFYTHIALANQFGSKELSAGAVEEMLEYWQGFNKKIILFVGMPHFPNSREKLAKGYEPRMDSRISELSKRPELLALYRAHGVHVIDRDAYFCALNACRYFANDGSLNLVDPTHLSVAASKTVGRAWVSNDPVLKELVGRAP